MDLITTALSSEILLAYFRFALGFSISKKNYFRVPGATLTPTPIERRKRMKQDTLFALPERLLNIPYPIVELAPYPAPLINIVKHVA
jgi:hypothetical protein